VSQLTFNIVLHVGDKIAELPFKEAIKILPSFGNTELESAFSGISSAFGYLEKKAFSDLHGWPGSAGTRGCSPSQVQPEIKKFFEHCGVPL
jgi:hypothetical protein